MKTLHTLWAGTALLAAGTLLSGCETLVEVDVPPHEPKLAVRYTLSTQAPTADYRKSLEIRSLFVSTSQSTLSTAPLKGRTDATVVLRDEAGQVVEEFDNETQLGSAREGFYQPRRNFAGTPGHTYTLEAAAPGVEPVSATLTLPAVPTIETAAYAVRPNSGSGTYDRLGRLTVSVLDDAATTDYYAVYARVLDRNGRYWGSIRPDYSSPGADGPDIRLDRLQLSEGEYFTNQEVFSDATANGQRLNLATDVRLGFRGSYGPGGPAAPAYVEVIVSSMTPDTYRFYQSLRRYYDTNDNPFAEPAPLFSNFPNGFGVFGGASDAVYRIAL